MQKISFLERKVDFEEVHRIVSWENVISSYQSFSEQRSMERRSFCLSASGAQKLRNEREYKLALIFALKIMQFLRKHFS